MVDPLDKDELAKGVAAHAVALHWQLEEVDERYARGDITRDEAKQIMRGCIRVFFDHLSRLIVRQLIREALEKVIKELPL